MKIEKTDKTMTFKALVSSITRLDTEFKGQAKRAVNTSLTLRNWAIGYYIEEYEREGADRAEYGERLMEELGIALTNRGSLGVTKKNYTGIGSSTSSISRFWRHCLQNSGIPVKNF